MHCNRGLIATIAMEQMDAKPLWMSLAEVSYCTICVCVCVCVCIGVANEGLPHAHEAWYAPRLAGSESVQHATPEARGTTDEGKGILKIEYSGLPLIQPPLGPIKVS